MSNKSTWKVSQIVFLSIMLFGMDFRYANFMQYHFDLIIVAILWFAIVLSWWNLVRTRWIVNEIDIEIKMHAILDIVSWGVSLKAYDLEVFQLWLMLLPTLPCYGHISPSNGTWEFLAIWISIQHHSAFGESQYHNPLDSYCSGMNENTLLTCEGK